MAGFQELDGPSFWSGGFCHMQHLARSSGFRFAVHGHHVRAPFLRYGTALMSTWELGDPWATTFDPSPPTFAKGMTIATMIFAGRLVDVASVHLDFLRSDVRKRQVAQMIRRLTNRSPQRPLVVMGDFNAEWHDRPSAVREFAQSLQLVAHEPDALGSAHGIATFPSVGARLDWILVSRELEFLRYEVLPDVVSDHFPVVAEVRFRGP